LFQAWFRRGIRIEFSPLSSFKGVLAGKRSAHRQKCTVKGKEQVKFVITQRRHRRDSQNGNQMTAAEPADLALHPAPLMRAGLPPHAEDVIIDEAWAGYPWNEASPPPTDI
jgi:hypothetical protein